MKQSTNDVFKGRLFMNDVHLCAVRVSTYDLIELGLEWMPHSLSCIELTTRNFYPELVNRSNMLATDSDVMCFDSQWM